MSEMELKKRRDALLERRGYGITHNKSVWNTLPWRTATGKLLRIPGK